MKKLYHYMLAVILFFNLFVLISNINFIVSAADPLEDIIVGKWRWGIIEGSESGSVVKGSLYVTWYGNAGSIEFHSNGTYTITNDTGLELSASGTYRIEDSTLIGLNQDQELFNVKL